jgi:hypothetical protein
MSFTSGLSNSGITRRLSRSAAVIGVLRSQSLAQATWHSVHEGLLIDPTNPFRYPHRTDPAASERGLPPYLNFKFSRLRSATDRQPISFISRSISQ